MDTLPSDVVLMCGCTSPVINDRWCVRCDRPNLMAVLAGPVVRVLDAETVDDIRRCDIWGCTAHHHARGRCRRHYDADRRCSPAP